MLAGIGFIESGHAHSGGSHNPNWSGIADPPIYGPLLDGQNGIALITDSDQGALDGNATYDRAVGPMQFLPSTWREYEVGASGHSAPNPQNIDDATLSAARYLCATGTRSAHSGRIDRSGVQLQPLVRLRHCRLVGRHPIRGRKPARRILCAGGIASARTNRGGPPDSDADSGRCCAVADSVVVAVSEPVCQPHLRRCRRPSTRRMRRRPSWRRPLRRPRCRRPLPHLPRHRRLRPLTHHRPRTQARAQARVRRTPRRRPLHPHRAHPPSASPTASPAPTSETP